MAMMHEKKHAREHRGSANGGNENWYNSKLWENTKAKSVSREVTTDALLKEKEDDDLRAKQRRAFACAY